MKFSFGQSEHECIEVDVQGVERVTVGKFYDDNWLRIEICVQAGGFSGKTTAEILPRDLTNFLSELHPLYQTLVGIAEFSTLERQFSLRLSGDARGHIELRGEILDKLGDGNRLNFLLWFDQSQLGASIRQIERIASQVPVRAAKR